MGLRWGGNLEAQRQADAAYAKVRSAKPKKRRLLPVEDGDSYQSRDAVLRRIGFKTYADYLRSGLWRKVRKKVYREKGDSCYLCGSWADALHHNRYHKNDLLGRKLKYIFPVCRYCHEQIEFDGNTKRHLRQVKAIFEERRRAYLFRTGAKP